MNYESLIFDIDGTLWDSRAIVAEGYNVQLRKENLSHLCVTAQDLKALFGKTMSEIADIMLCTIPAPERYALMERCMDTEQDYLLADPCNIGYPGVKETLLALKEKYRLFIVSNSQCGYPEIVIDKMGLQGIFQGHLCFGDTGTSKGKTIRTLMAKHGIENALYIGDTQGDYEATVEADIPFVWCTYGFGTPEGYVKKVDSFPELLEVL